MFAQKIINTVLNHIIYNQSIKRVEELTTQ